MIGKYGLFMKRDGSSFFEYITSVMSDQRDRVIDMPREVGDITFHMFNAGVIFPDDKEMLDKDFSEVHWVAITAPIMLKFSHGNNFVLS